MQPAIYIVTNKRNGVLYTSVTSNLARRAYEHKEVLVDGFSKKYNCKILVYYDAADTMEAAIMREKQIKGWTRIKKIELIEQLNPDWDDLYKYLV